MVKQKKGAVAPEGEELELNMTPMIDIVFQLIVFFMLTLKFKDIDRRIDSHLPDGRGLVASADFVDEVDKIKVKLFRRDLKKDESQHYTQIRMNNVHNFSLPRGWQGFRQEVAAAGADGPRVRAYKATMERILTLVKQRRAQHPGDPMELKGEISAPPPKGGSVPHGDIMQILDVFLRANVTDVWFEGKTQPLTKRERAALAGD